MDAPTISPRLLLRTYRSAPLSLGSNGAWTPIEWDAEVIKNGVLHDVADNREQLVTLLAGFYVLRASVTLNGALLLTSTELRVTRNGAQVAHVFGPAIAAGAKLTLPPASGLFVAAVNDVVVVEARSVGVGGIDVEPGDGVTYCEILLL